MNRSYWIHFLDEHLRTPGDKILQKNIFIIIPLLEMTASARFCAIIHIIVCIPTRGLEGNFHFLEDYNLSILSMGRMVDELETFLDAIEEEEGGNSEGGIYDRPMPRDNG